MWPDQSATRWKSWLRRRQEVILDYRLAVLAGVWLAGSACWGGGPHLSRGAASAAAGCGAAGTLPSHWPSRCTARWRPGGSWCKRAGKRGAAGTRRRPPPPGPAYSGSRGLWSSCCCSPCSPNTWGRRRTLREGRGAGEGQWVKALQPPPGGGSGRGLSPVAPTCPLGRGLSPMSTRTHTSCRSDSVPCDERQLGTSGGTMVSSAGRDAQRTTHNTQELC